MELRQLRYLVAVADEAGFTRAAQRLFVAQPGLSAQISQLEREVGQRLFERTSRGATPTESGAVLIGHARAVLARVDDARAELDELAGLLRGSVTVGLVRGAPLGGLAATLGRFRREHPGISMSLHEDESEALVAGLQQGVLDVALVGLADTSVPGLTTRVLLDDRLVVLVALDDRWAARRSVPLAALVDRELIALARGSGMRTAFEAACRRSGLDPRVAYEVGTVANAVELVHEGLGAAVLPTAAAAAAPGLHPVAITRPTVRSRLALAWVASAPTDGRPATRALVAAADDHANCAGARRP